MRKFVLVAGCALVIGAGCKVYDGLIGHPLHVLHQQHEYNEEHKNDYRESKTNSIEKP